MTPIEKGVGAQSREEFEAVDGQEPVSIYYMLDPNSGKYLSLESTTLICARANAQPQGYMNMEGAPQMTATHGYVIPHDATLVWVGIRTNDLNVNIRKNGTTIQTITQSVSLDLDFDEGDLIQFEFPLVGLGLDAMCVASLRWRA